MKTLSSDAGHAGSIPGLGGGNRRDPPPPSQGKAVGDPRPVDINSKMRPAEQLRQEAGPRPGDLFSPSLKSGDSPLTTCPQKRLLGGQWGVMKN